MLELIKIAPQDDTDIYLQIRYQFTYLIATRQIGPGSQLPSVRTLADGLNVSKGSVQLAYRELQADGLVEVRPVIGTFVMSVDATGTDSQVLRQHRLTELMRSAVVQAMNMGFSPSTLSQRLNVFINRTQDPMRVVFVGPTQSSAEQHAAYISEHLVIRPLEITPVSMEYVIGGVERVRSIMNGVYFFVTFTLLRADLERELTSRGGLHEIVSVSTELADTTLPQLQAIDPRSRVAVIAEAEFIQGFLGLVMKATQLPKEQIAAFKEADLPPNSQVLHDYDVVVHSSGILPMLTTSNLPSRRLLELKFQVSRSSRERLADVLFHDVKF